MIESIPKELTLPNAAAYPPSELFLFDRHNRDTWEQAFGEPASPWDKERRIKRWADTSVLEGVDPLDLISTIVGYEYFDVPEGLGQRGLDTFLDKPFGVKSRHNN